MREGVHPTRSSHEATILRVELLLHLPTREVSSEAKAEGCLSRPQKYMRYGQKILQGYSEGFIESFLKRYWVSNREL